MPKTVVFIAFDGVIDLDLVGPLQVFATGSGIAAARDGVPLYRNVVASIGGAPVTTAAGLRLETVSLEEIDVEDVDTIIVPGGRESQRLGRDSQLVAWLAQNAMRVRRTCSVCVGAFLLGEAGLLEGRRVTTHWLSAPELQARHPMAKVLADRIFQCDDSIWSSAGVSAGIDLALHLVESDHGRKLAMEIARMLVVFLRRPGDQKQFSSALRLQSRQDPAFSALIAWASDHLAGDLSVQALADRVGMSPRTFARKFRAGVGQTPAAAMNSLRLEAARRMLEEGSPSLKAIAAACGFVDQQRLRRAFVDGFGITPTEHVNRFR